MRTGSRKGRRRRDAGLLIGCAVMLASLLLAVAFAGGARRSADDVQAQAIAALEGGHVHGGTAADARADRIRAARCAKPAWRAAHLANCPSGRLQTTATRGVQAAMVTSTPQITGRWAAPFQVPLWPIHEILLPTGKVLWLMKGENSSKPAPAYLWDPATNTTKRVDAPNVTYPDGSVKPANLWCSGHTVLPDGRVLVAGGNLAYRDPAGGPGSGYKGPRWLFTFDPWTEQWTRQPDMRRGRWYPTVITLPDGRALIMGGWDEAGNDADNTDVEVFTPGPRGGAPGTVAVVAQRETALYPHLVVVPDTTAAGAPAGTQVLVAGPSPTDTAILNVNDWSWRGVADLPTSRTWGNTILLPGTGARGSHEVMVLGGYDERQDPTTQPTSAILDLDRINDGWRTGPRMANGRSHLNLVAMPDDALLAIGGGAGRGDYQGSLDSFYAGPVYATERLDPATGQWAPADVQADERTYHSTALLLPDATVLSAGDDRATHDAGHRTGEIYSPPYLFKGGTRPTITAAPQSVRYNAAFQVATPVPGAIDRAVLVRPSSVTHATDDQRVLRLTTTPNGSGVGVVSPSGPSIAPPGWYMLFLMDRDGRPSKAAWVQLSSAAPAQPAPPNTPAPPVPSTGTSGPGASGGGTPGGATVSGTGGSGQRRGGAKRPKAATVPALVKKAMWRNGVLRLVVRVSLRKATATQVSLTVPGGGPDATRVRTYGKGAARAVIVNLGFPGPKAWTVLSLPISIAQRPGATVRGRIVITMRKGTPVAKVVAGR